LALATLTVQVDYRTPTALEDIALGYVLAITAPFLLTGLLVLAVAWLLGRR
jgi:hypothetical protein